MTYKTMQILENKLNECHYKHTPKQDVSNKSQGIHFLKLSLITNNQRTKLYNYS